MGWSDGGITALIMAGRNPQNVSKLVVWGANSFVTEDDIKLYEGKHYPSLHVHSNYDAKILKTRLIRGVCFLQISETWTNGVH